MNRTDELIATCRDLTDDVEKLQAYVVQLQGGIVAENEGERGVLWVKR